MKIDDIKNIGLLARMELTDAECETLAKQFDGILKYVEKMDELDLESLEPASHPFDLTNAFRDDEPQPSMGASQLMELAPDHSKDMIRVPKIIEGKS